MAHHQRREAERLAARMMRGPDCAESFIDEAVNALRSILEDDEEEF